jgi:hypothetical protein
MAAFQADKPVGPSKLEKKFSALFLCLEALHEPN